MKVREMEKLNLKTPFENGIEIDNNKELNKELYFANKQSIKLLTKRQLECLTLCAYGFSNSRISKILFISESTVKKTLEEIFRRLKVKGRTSAVTLAFVFGILNTDILNKTAQQYQIQTQNREEWEW